MNKRQLSALGTRKKIIETARKLLAEKGFNAINVSDITRTAGIGKGTFYTHFKRKEDVVLEIGREAFQEIGDAVSQMADTGIMEKLAFYFDAFMKAVERYGIHICREWTRDVLNPNTVPDNKDGKKWDYDVRMLTDILDSAVRSGELKADTPVEALVHIIICELYGMMTCWCMSDGRFEPLDWTDCFCRILLEPVLGKYLAVR